MCNIFQRVMCLLIIFCTWPPTNTCFCRRFVWWCFSIVASMRGMLLKKTNELPIHASCNGRFKSSPSVWALDNSILCRLRTTACHVLALLCKQLGAKSTGDRLTKCAPRRRGRDGAAKKPAIARTRFDQQHPRQAERETKQCAQARSTCAALMKHQNTCFACCMHWQHAYCPDCHSTSKNWSHHAPY